MKRLYRLSPVLLMLLMGCASLGVAPAQTFNQKLAYAYGVHTAILQATTSAVTAGNLSSTDAQKVLAQSDNAKVFLDGAASLSASGNATGATDKLALATATLTALQTFLNSHAAPPGK